MPSEYVLDLYRGDTHTWRFRLWKDVNKTDPVVLNGVTAKSQIRTETDTLIATLECVVTQPNIIDVTLPATEAAKLTTAPAMWDIQLTYPDGHVHSPIAGPVKVQPDATQ